MRLRDKMNSPDSGFSGPCFKETGRYLNSSYRVFTIPLQKFQTNSLSLLHWYINLAKHTARSRSAIAGRHLSSSTTVKACLVEVVRRCSCSLSPIQWNQGHWKCKCSRGTIDHSTKARPLFRQRYGVNSPDSGIPDPARVCNWINWLPNQNREWHGTKFWGSQDYNRNWPEETESDKPTFLPRQIKLRAKESAHPWSL